MKFFLMVMAFYALFWLVRRSWRQIARTARPMPPTAAVVPEPMLRCLECGLHLPKHEALIGPGGVFCSEAHRLAHARRPSA